MECYEKNAVAIVEDYGHEWEYDEFSLKTDSLGYATLVLDDYPPEEVPWYVALQDVDVTVLGEGTVWKVWEFSGRPQRTYYGVTNDGYVQCDVQVSGRPYTVSTSVSRVEKAVSV